MGSVARADGAGGRAGRGVMMSISGAGLLGLGGWEIGLLVLLMMIVSRIRLAGVHVPLGTARLVDAAAAKSRRQAGLAEILFVHECIVVCSG